MKASGRLGPHRSIETGIPHFEDVEPKPPFVWEPFGFFIQGVDFILRKVVGFPVLLADRRVEDTMLQKEIPHHRNHLQVRQAMQILLHFRQQILLHTLYFFTLSANFSPGRNLEAARRHIAGSIKVGIQSGCSIIPLPFPCIT